MRGAQPRYEIIAVMLWKGAWKLRFILYNERKLDYGAFYRKKTTFYGKFGKV